MPEDNKKQEPADPMEVWEQWYETTYDAWKNSVDGSKESFVDPYGLYRSWLKGIAAAQEQFKAGTAAAGLVDPQEAWKHWFEATTDVWKKATEQGADPLGLTTQWLEMMEEARARLSAGGTMPADPFTFLKQWYDATNEIWSKVVGDIIGTEKFMDMASQFLESYTSFTRTFSRASEAYFSRLQLPTRSDIARVAELVINLEDKVDRLDNEFESFEDRYMQITTGEAISGLSGRLERVESDIAALPAAVESLEKRLERVESKLDTLLEALEKPGREEPAKAVRPAPAPRSRAQQPKPPARKQRAAQQAP
jgi:polyhydroxyalkanoic acid synthase PhaR subunit